MYSIINSTQWSINKTFWYTVDYKSIKWPLGRQKTFINYLSKLGICNFSRQVLSVAATDKRFICFPMKCCTKQPYCLLINLCATVIIVFAKHIVYFRSSKPNLGYRLIICIKSIGLHLLIWNANAFCFVNRMSKLNIAKDRMRNKTALGLTLVTFLITAVCCIKCKWYHILAF